MRDIEETIKNHTPSLIGLDEVYHGAVCIPLIREGSDHNILFQVRSETIKGQPGDVCFPGGRVEEGESPEEAAIRECCEELLISREQIRIIGASDVFHRETTIIYPYVAELTDYNGTFSSAEVSRVFSVPLTFFLNTEPQRFSVNSRIQPGEDFPYERIKGGKNYKWRNRSFDELFYEYEGTTIWGLTARIIYSFARIIR